MNKKFDRENFDKKSLKHYDNSIFVFRMAIWSLVLGAIGYLGMHIYEQVSSNIHTILFKILDGWTIFGIVMITLCLIIGIFYMILFTYDYYIGQNKRIKKKLNKENKK